MYVAEALVKSIRILEVPAVVLAHRWLACVCACASVRLCLCLCVVCVSVYRMGRARVVHNMPFDDVDIDPGLTF